MKIEQIPAIKITAAKVDIIITKKVTKYEIQIEGLDTVEYGTIDKAMSFFQNNDLLLDSEVASVRKALALL